MYYPIVNRYLKPSLVIVLLICCIGLVASISSVEPPTAAAKFNGYRAPVRLRLRVDNNTLRSGQATTVHAEFLDVDYQQVPSDGTRTIEFAITFGSSGAISPAQVTVKPGSWSADATFASGQAGKVVITARSGGLDSAQTMIVVVRPAASLLSRLFETVAYADEIDGFQLFAGELTAPANNLGRVSFRVTFNEIPPAGTMIRISIGPPAFLVWGAGEKDRGAVTDITLPVNKAVSDSIDIVSGTPNDFDLKAYILPNGPEQHLKVTFSPPHPNRIVFGDSLTEIGPYKTEANICVKLADDSSKPMRPDKKREVKLSSEDPVEFNPPLVRLSPNKDFAEAKIRLKGFPVSGEIRLLAEETGEDSLLSGEKVIVVRSVLDKVVITGPSEVRQGSNAEFTVRLADKENKTRTADFDRTIDLSATSGTLSPNRIKIEQGQEAARVRYTSSGATGNDVIKAESGGLNDGSLPITLVTALYWLLTFALGGGLLGGIVRLIPVGDKVERLLPRWTADSWQLLIGRLVGSIVSGLFLYLAVKFGMSKLGSAAAGLDLGTKLAAFFFGGIGGFAGTLVLDRLVNWLLPGPPQTNTAQVTT